MSTASTTPPSARVVVRPPNWLGDAVMALPAIAAIRRHFCQNHLTIAAAPAVAALFREDTDGAPDRVIDLPTDTRGAVALLEGEGFDIGILLPNSFRSAWQFWRAGVPERWGIARSGRGFLLTRRAPRRLRPATPHQADFYRALVGRLGIACDASALPRLAPRSPSVQRAAALLAERKVPAVAGLVGLAPGAAYGQAKQYPPDRVAQLIVRLVRDRGVVCVLLGASHDRIAARAIESWIRDRAPDALKGLVDLTGHTSLGALVGLIDRMDVFVSNDSGAMHVAAALGRPVVALFGPTDERATRPLGDARVLTAPVFCRPCMLRDCPIDHRCMTRIAIDDIFDAVAARLPAGGATA
jgi:heptosyltransferase-2